MIGVEGPLGFDLDEEEAAVVCREKPAQGEVYITSITRELREETKLRPVELVGVGLNLFVEQRA